MLSHLATSTFEYLYLDTMGEYTKGLCFGGQGRCIILAVEKSPRSEWWGLLSQEICTFRFSDFSPPGIT